MPTLLQWRGYRFFLYSAEAKIWLTDLNLAINLGYSAKELNEIIRKTREERDRFLEAWHDYFAN